VYVGVGVDVGACFFKALSQISDQKLALCGFQLLLRSETRYYSKGTIIADSREEAKGLMVITSGQVFLTYVHFNLSGLRIVLSCSHK
jgi:hypothetical protein